MKAILAVELEEALTAGLVEALHRRGLGARLQSVVSERAAEAVRQARQAIRRARRQHPERRIIVSGCAAQVETAAFAEMPEVDQVIGNHDKLRAASYVRAGDSPVYRAMGIDVLTIEAGRVVEITAFLRPDLFPRFGLPETL